MFTHLAMDYTQINIEPKVAEKIVSDLYQLHGIATKLPGEIDFNFRINVEGENGYLLKISRPDEDLSYLDFQVKLMQYVAENATELISPEIIPDNSGTTISEITDAHGNLRKVRLLTWIPGRVWSNVNPQLDNLRISLGRESGKLALAMQGFDHQMAHRKFDWDNAQGAWTKEFMHLFNDEQKAVLNYFLELFDTRNIQYKNLRKSVVHNDGNDNNIIVSNDLINPVVKANIDFGDAIHTQVINDLAIVCAYAIMHHNDSLDAALPIVKGYHSSFPLKEEELSHLYYLIGMRLIISVTKSAINKSKEPDNTYLLISEKPAWDLLNKWKDVSEDFAHFSFRQCCGFSPHPNEDKFRHWAEKHRFSLAEIFPTINKSQVHKIDLSVSSRWLGHEAEFNDLKLFQFKIEREEEKHTDKIIAGGYLEARCVYTSDAYDKMGNFGRESRTIHTGIDFWLPAETPVHALFDGEVEFAVIDKGDKEYGGLIVLKHLAEDIGFFTLYGHNKPETVLKWKKGDKIKKGEQIAVLGNFPENGNWVPHSHFQVMLSMLDYKDDFPGVVYHNQIETWISICPDPNLLFKLKDLEAKESASNNELINYRKEHLGKSLSLQYDVPIKMVRGSGPYLVDQFGRKYLDTVNNVAHVGHEHPAVLKAGQEQMAILNTNTRYLHENINEFAQEILETLPKELSVLHFVNSGSEANELAIRMAKAFTGETDVIASEVGYHGNANTCVDISSYKFDGKGGKGRPEHTQIFPIPDAFRGKYRGQDSGKYYAKEVKNCIQNIHKKGRNVAALIVESIISCGGQIELPEGFLQLAYQYVHATGGLCIADEVQVGVGRVGKAFWGFQLHDVVPDIVTIGKPIGNGHPLAAVACTRKVADAFANGMEYFNTFGGNPVSCAIGTEVLRTVKRENLQQNALNVGEYLKGELEILAVKYPIIGDVRGQGLFLGIELVDINLKPLAEQTSYLANRMKDHGILMSIDGPDHNVLKIKPPIVFSMEHAIELLFYLDKVLKEDFMTK